MKTKVVLIDDDAIYRMVATRLLNLVDKNLKIDEFENGRLALDYLCSHLDPKTNYTIFLDINMPVLDGWGFLEELQSSNLKECDNLNIYIVSSSTDSGDLNKAKKYPVVKKFLHKPLSKTELEVLIAS